jgi:hypothetical protein
MTKSEGLRMTKRRGRMTIMFAGLIGERSSPTMLMSGKETSHGFSVKSNNLNRRKRRCKENM